MPFSGDVVRLQLIESMLGSDRKPVFRSSIGCAPAETDPTTCHASYFPEEPVITGADTFSQWYRTQAGVNLELQKTLELTDNGAGQYVYDSGMFFPLGADEGFGLTPANNARMTNFLFTTEIHGTFTYRAGQSMTFRGDDDVWIFVNGILALDLGGLHPAAESSIDFDAQADRLGIVPGASYPIDFFHAERHTIDSRFRLQTNISCFVPVRLE
jgi:fibro-slime domain-containing protein